MEPEATSPPSDAVIAAASSFFIPCSVLAVVIPFVQIAMTKSASQDPLSHWQSVTASPVKPIPYAHTYALDRHLVNPRSSHRSGVGLVFQKNDYCDKEEPGAYRGHKSRFVLNIMCQILQLDVALSKSGEFLSKLSDLLSKVIILFLDLQVVL